MSQSRRTSLTLLAFVLVLVALLGIVEPAFAEMEQDPKATSKTHPFDPTDRKALWRHGWGTSAYPEITFTDVGKDTLGDKTIPTLGFWYTFDRDPNGVPPVGGPNVTSDETGPFIGHTFDLQGIYNALPAGARDYHPRPGEKVSSVLEGPWYLHVRFFNEYRSIAASSTITYFFGMDRTPPAPVENFAAGTVIPSPGGSTVILTTPTETRRRILTWTRKQYDGLSGVGLFRILIDGAEKTVIPVPYYVIPNTLTIEDMPAGTHTLSVQVLDRATNASTLVSQRATVDYDLPVVKITYPTSGVGVYGTKKFTVGASDLACAPGVWFKIDGTWMGSDATWPYELNVDTTKLTKGLHTFTVLAKDLYGHTSTASTTFNVDNVPITFSGVGDSPDPFYPRKQDGYKDNSKIGYTLSKAASRVWVRIYSGSKLIREYTGSNAGVGYHSSSWNGRAADGSMTEGTYYYQIVAQSYNGSVWATGKYPTTLRYTELVRVAPNQYQVVDR